MSVVHSGVNRFDVVVVGAGIVGAACGDECIRQGMSVALVNGDAIGGGATSAAMGHIVVMDDSDAQFTLTRYSQRLWQELRPALPADVEYEPRGTIWVAADELEMAEVRRKHTYYSEHGVPVKVLDQSALEDIEPNLRKGLAGGLLVPEDIVLYPPCAARFLVERARTGGAAIHPGSTVSAIGNGRVRLDNGMELSASAIINAAGTGAPALTSGLAVKKRKGHLTITDSCPGFIRHQLVELGYLKSAHSIPGDSVAFNVQPRKNGQVVIGSSRQYDVEGEQVDEIILDRMRRRAAEYMPNLPQLPTVRVWTGFRPATPDNLPLIGPWPGDQTVFLATGHEGLGITTSLATARILVDQIAGKKSAIPVEPYLPSRVSSERVHV
jgi:glycine/D-amino acid oxidase-like deaminating enzyme